MILSIYSKRVKSFSRPTNSARKSASHLRFSSGGLKYWNIWKILGNEISICYSSGNDGRCWEGHRSSIGIEKE
jgi:hypothetical protein